MKNKKKFSLFGLASFSLIATPLLATSCGAASERTNLVTTYDNALDDAITLGIAPDYNSYGNWVDYLSKYAAELKNNANVMQLNYRFFPKGENNTINLKNISKTNADVVVANITDSGKANTLKDVVNNIVYTGRGDDSEWCYNDEIINFVDSNNQAVGVSEDGNSFAYIKNSKNDSQNKAQKQSAINESGGQNFNNSFIYPDYGYTYKLYELQQNPFLALKKLASSLDSLSENKNNFVQKAENVEWMQKQRIQSLNKNSKIQELINGKTIAFVLGKKSTSTSNDVSDNFHLYTPHTYPQFYSQNSEKGLKMNFPIFSSIGDFNGSHFADPDIISGDESSYHTFKNSTNGSKLINMFPHKFDYVVYMAYDASPNVHDKQTVVNSDIKNFLKITNTGTNVSPASLNDVESHIFYTTYSDLYMSTWGPIGQSLGISKFIEWINGNLITNENEKIQEDDSLILHKNIDFNNLKRWRNIK